MANFSLKQLILFAYNVPNNQVSGKSGILADLNRSPLPSSGRVVLRLCLSPLGYKSLLAQWARNWDGEASFFLTLNAGLALRSRRS